MRDRSEAVPRERQGRRRAAVRFSRVDRDRLASGELENIRGALRDPQLRSGSVDEPGSAQSSSDATEESWLKENVPPHW